LSSNLPSGNCTLSSILLSALALLTMHPDQAIGTLEWSPFDPWILLTGGHDGCIRVWDVRDAFFPLTTKSITRGWVLNVCWYAPSVVVLSTDTGAVQLFYIEESTLSMIVTHQDAVWGLALESGSMVTSAGLDGYIQKTEIPGRMRSGKRNQKYKPTVLMLAADVAKSAEETSIVFSHVRRKSQTENSETYRSLDAAEAAWQTARSFANPLKQNCIWRAVIGFAGILVIDTSAEPAP